MENMTPEEKQLVRENFLIDFGRYISRKRLNKNISMEDLAEFIGVSQSTLSRYENGKSDMNISNIPLLSLYCDFALDKCFSSLDVHKVLDSFREIVNIKRTRYKREKDKGQVDFPKKTLKAQIFDIDGKEVIEYTKPKAIEQMSIREQFSRAVVDLSVEPYTHEEFMEYLRVEEDGCLLDMMDGAWKILAYIGDMPRKEQIKAQIADFVIDNVIIEKIIDSDCEAAKRAYMYYKMFLESK